MDTLCKEATSKALWTRAHPGRGAIAVMAGRQSLGVSVMRAARRDFSTCRTAHWQWKDATASSDPTTGPWQEDVLRDSYHAEVRKSAKARRGRTKVL